MKPSLPEFEQQWQNGELVLSFIGMSNIGKSYWSRQMATLGFDRICCDDEVEAKIEPELTELGLSGIEDMSTWMGQPYEARSKETQKRYLELEKEVMRETFDRLEHLEKPKNIVIDTTGSVVHLGDEICEELRKKSFVIYFEANAEKEKQMFERYMEKPKPVVFGDIFQEEEGKTDLENLEICYPKLLQFRKGLYEQYADLIISRDIVPRDMTTDDFVELLKNLL